MAIFNITEFAENRYTSDEKLDLSDGSGQESKKDHLFSCIAARVFFGLLLLADALWGIFTLARIAFYGSLGTLTLFRVTYLRRKLAHSYLSLKRSLVCGFSLFIAIFSPALGIMFSCMYFLMYDRAGVEEIVPSSLQDQFKEFFQQHGG